MSAPTPPDDLQFATAEPTAHTVGSDAGPALRCVQCAQPIATSYFTVAGRTMCGTCKGNVERALAGEGTSRTGRITKALVYGFGASLVGAAIWFGVEVVFDLQIGLVAILIGWMVGRAVQVGSGNRGGRRYQVVAALLTYLSVAMSYGALGIREIAQSDDTPAASASHGAVAGAKVASDSGATASAPASDVEAVTMDGTIVPATAAASDSTSRVPLSGGAFAKAVAVMLGFMFVLPIMANLSSMPSGILGLAIMGFGIYRAWQMNAAVAIPNTGPHRIGGAPAAAA